LSRAKTKEKDRGEGTREKGERRREKDTERRREKGESRIWKGTQGTETRRRGIATTKGNARAKESAERMRNGTQ